MAPKKKTTSKSKDFKPTTQNPKSKPKPKSTPKNQNKLPNSHPLLPPRTPLSSSTSFPTAIPKHSITVSLDRAAKEVDVVEFNPLLTPSPFLEPEVRERMLREKRRRDLEREKGKGKERA